MSSPYREVYDRWKTDPLGFWKVAASDVDWFSPPTEIYRPDIKPYGRWFVDGMQHMPRRGRPSRCRWTRLVSSHHLQ
ncbi:hypothetical protein BRAS3843_140036 [Bradyrhizobium sp. STM 3843]|nr:hypothetical protein BRAS3843_140036 [Bradyrhizobium sp. STM 3843]